MLVRVRLVERRVPGRGEPGGLRVPQVRLRRAQVRPVGLDLGSLPGDVDERRVDPGGAGFGQQLLVRPLVDRGRAG